MAKDALRNLQARLADRMQAARSQQAVRSWLAVECGSVGYLLPLAEAGEIFPAGLMQRVPYTRPWFMGVANLRGGLFGVVDLAGFVGGKVSARRDNPRDEARLVAFNASLDLNCALWVDRLAGLRSLERLKPLADHPATDLPAARFVGELFEDDTGRQWRELRLSELANEPAFLGIAEGI